MLDSLWQRLLSALEGKLPDTALDSWLRPCRLAAIDGDVLHVAAPNKFARDWLTQHHLAALEAAARDVLGGAPRVLIELDREPGRAAPAPTASSESAPQAASTTVVMIAAAIRPKSIRKFNFLV